jgi:epoxyqueuosine reductase
MGDRLYGCDDCLEACPPGSRALAAATRRSGRVPLREILRADDRTLRDRYPHWYVPRNQPRHIRRNALVALGNTRPSWAAAVAAGFAGHPDWLLRAHAVWALGRIGGPAARAALEAAERRERDERVRAEAASAVRAVRSAGC